MPHQIIHWNGFDSGSNLPDDYYPNQHVSFFTGYVVSGSGWSTFYGYGKFAYINSGGDRIRIYNPNPSSAMGVQFLIGMNDSGIGEISICRFIDLAASADQISFRLAWNGGTSRYDLRIYRGTTLIGTVASFCQGGVANAWQWISAVVHAHGSNGVVKIRSGMNDQMAFTFSGNTQNTSSQRIDAVEIGSLTTGTSGTYFDDFIVSNCLPSDDPMFRYRVYGAQMPTGNDAVQSSVFGATNNWQAINETSPNGDASYVFASNPGTQDTYDISWPSLSSTIMAVRVTARCRKDEAGPAMIRLLTKRGSLVFASPQFAVSNGYELDQHEMLTDPATGARWTPSMLSSQTKIGFRLD